LTERQNDRKELLRRLVEFAIGFEVEIDVDQMGSGKELDRLASQMESLASSSYLEDHA